MSSSPGLPGAPNPTGAGLNPPPDHPSAGGPLTTNRTPRPFAGLPPANMSPSLLPEWNARVAQMNAPLPPIATMNPDADAARDAQHAATHFGGDSPSFSSLMGGLATGQSPQSPISSPWGQSTGAFPGAVSHAPPVAPQSAAVNPSPQFHPSNPAAPMAGTSPRVAHHAMERLRRSREADADALEESSRG